MVLVMEAVVEPFQYHGTLVENVRLLSREVTKKNEVLVSSQTYFSTVEDALDEAN